MAVTVGCGNPVLSRELSLCAWSGDAGTVAVAAVTSNVVYVATVRRMVRRMARCTVRCITVASGAGTRTHSVLASQSYNASLRCTRR